MNVARVSKCWVKKLLFSFLFKITRLNLHILRSNFFPALEKKNAEIELMQQNEALKVNELQILS